MDKKERVILIRRGNELFNKGDFKNALKIFLAVNYQDGIVRVADHLYYEEENKIGAIKLYKKAGYTKRIEEFAEKAAVTIQAWLAEDKEKETPRIKKWEPVVLKVGDIIPKEKNGRNHEKNQ